MYLLPKPSLPPQIPNMAVYWALLLLDFAEDVTKLKALRTELICSRRVHTEKGLVETIILQRYIQWETEGHMLFLWERELR